MSDIGKPERATQDRVIALFRDEMHYRFLGDWSDRAGNSNIEAHLLQDYLASAGYSSGQVSRALDVLHREADHHGRSVYGNNQAVYGLLRYGVPVKIDAGKVTETVHLINWRMDRAERGVYLNIEPKYLLDYGAEAAFRSDTRRLPNGEQLKLALNLALSVGASLFWTGFTHGRHRPVELLLPAPQPAPASGPAKGRHPISSANGRPPR